MHLVKLSSDFVKKPQKAQFICFMFDSDLTNNINNIHPKCGIRIYIHNQPINSLESISNYI
jgi:hypothetical protein